MAIHIAETVHGRFMYLSEDVYLSRFLGVYCEYSPDEAKIFNQILRSGDIAVDIGAHIGCHTIAMAKMVSPNGLVYAFEPQTRIYYILCGNVALNNLDNVVCMNMGISDKREILFIPPVDYSLPNNYGGLSLQQESADNKSQPIGCMILDEVAYNFLHLRLVKADVEGMEQKVLKGGAEAIKKHRPFLYVEADRPEEFTPTVKLMGDLNYRVYKHTPRYISPIWTEADEDIRNLVSLNLLGVPKELDCTVSDLEELN